MRTRAENAARKGLRILNERKRAKVPSSQPPAPPSPLAGERFGKLTAMERGEDYLRPDGRAELRWWFTCDCGTRLLWKVSTVRSNVIRLGWCSCADCYRAAGGWQALASKEGQ